MDQVITLLDFDATAPGELSFKKGETLTVLDRKYEHWWFCKNENGAHGVLPRNHVKPKSRFGSSTRVKDGKKSANRRQHTPISKKMDVGEVVSQLINHGCNDLTGGLDLSSFDEYPVSHGGFSDIYRGKLLDGTLVAVKALRVSVDTISRDPKHLKHAARELHTWGKCRHPNVLPLLGLAIFRNRIGMVAPWMEYGILPRYLESMPGVNRLEMCVQICEGLTYLHRIDIIHCDLKGANILVSDKGVPVLTDFGNSSLVDRTLGFTQTTSGPSFTVRWSAPEIIEEITAHTKASDVYALGMAIYETMTGNVPYQGRSESNVIRLVTVKRELPERPEGMQSDRRTTDKLWTLLTLCWSFEPAARPSAAEVAEIIRGAAFNAQIPVNHQSTSSHFVYRSAAPQLYEDTRKQGTEGDHFIIPNVQSITPPIPANTSQPSIQQTMAADYRPSSGPERTSNSIYPQTPGFATRIGAGLSSGLSGLGFGRPELMRSGSAQQGVFPLPVNASVAGTAPAPRRAVPLPASSQSSLPFNQAAHSGTSNRPETNQTRGTTGPSLQVPMAGVTIRSDLEVNRPPPQLPKTKGFPLTRPFSRFTDRNKNKTRTQIEAFQAIRDQQDLERQRQFGAANHDGYTGDDAHKGRPPSPQDFAGGRRSRAVTEVSTSDEDDWTTGRSLRGRRASSPQGSARSRLSRAVTVVSTSDEGAWTTGRSMKGRSPSPQGSVRSRLSRAVTVDSTSDEDDWTTGRSLKGRPL